MEEMMEHNIWVRNHRKQHQNTADGFVTTDNNTEDNKSIVPLL